MGSPALPVPVDSRPIPAGGREVGTFDTLDTLLKMATYPEKCNHVEKVKLERCMYVNDSALRQLDYLRTSLNSLAIIKCYGISKKGLLSLENLNNLKELQLSGLGSLESEELNACVKELSRKLPSCEIRTSERVAEADIKKQQNK